MQYAVQEYMLNLVQTKDCRWWKWYWIFKKYLGIIIILMTKKMRKSKISILIIKMEILTLGNHCWISTLVLSVLQRE